MLESRNSMKRKQLIKLRPKRLMPKSLLFRNLEMHRTDLISFLIFNSSYLSRLDVIRVSQLLTSSNDEHRKLDSYFLNKRNLVEKIRLEFSKLRKRNCKQLSIEEMLREMLPLRLFKKNEQTLR